MRRVIAILNPVSGRRNTRPLIHKVAHLVRSGGGRFELLETAGQGDATRLASRVDSDVDAVLVAGGDGTVCEVVNGLLRREDSDRPGETCPVVILATGTENLLARELVMPTAPRQVARTLLYGEPFPFDVGLVNGRGFLVVVGIGFDAECVIRMMATRGGHITHWDYFWPIWRTFWAYGFPRLRVDVDDKCVFEGRGLVLIGVIARYSAGMRILCRAKYDDGLLDVCVLPCVSRMRLAAHAYRAVRRNHLGHGGVIYQQGRRLRVSSSEEVPIEVDGELGGVLPVECAVAPGAARFLRLN